MDIANIGVRSMRNGWDFPRHYGLILLLTIGNLGLAIAMGLSHRDWLSWLLQGPLDNWLHGNSVLVFGCIMGIATLTNHSENGRRGLAFSCLAGLLVVALWVLGQFGAAMIMIHWYPAPENALHKMVPVLGGVLCGAPLFLAPYISSARRKRRAAASEPLDGNIENLPDGDG